MSKPANVIDVTDATFQKEVIERSMTTPVVVDLWATWCGPCKTLGPILEKVIGATNGKVVLAKIDVDKNPGVARAFQVQSIPAVYALKDGQPVDGFMGALPEHQVKEFVNKLIPGGEVIDVATLLARGDEASLREALKL
ncbi:MAG: thioredoxin, partial [Actinomycetota bacterium]